MMNTKTPLYIFIALAILLGGMFVFGVFDNSTEVAPAAAKSVGEVEPVATPVVAGEQDVAVDPYKDWKTYKSDAYDFSLRYPPNWIAVEDTQFTAGGFVKFYPSSYGAPDKYAPEFIRVGIESQGPNTLSAKYGIESLQELRQRDILAGLEGKHQEYQDYIKANYSSTIEDLGGFQTLIISLGPKYGISEMYFPLEESTYIVFDNYQTPDSLSQERALHEKILRSLTHL